MPETRTPEEVEAQTAAFQQRFDLARMVLERKFRWARLTLRNLEPVRREEGTLAVDKYHRLYWGPISETWTDKEFVGCLWHEVNHLLRHHPERLDGMPKAHNMAPAVANLAADLEINDDLRDQGITLPKGVFYSDRPELSKPSVYTHPDHVSAEEHFMFFVDNVEEEEEGPGGEGDGGEGEEQEGEGTSSPSGSNNPDNPGQGGSPKPSQGEAPRKSPHGSNMPDPQCGSGAGNEPGPDEKGEPDPDNAAKLERDQRKQAEEIVKAVEEGGSQGIGISQDMYRASVEFLGKSETDWRSQMATEVRNAIEQRADEAEEYTFRRRSRRAYDVNDIILPGSYRPIPKLGVVVDVSSSMDRAKIESAMREVHGILERLAIPSFTAYPTNTDVQGSIVIQSHLDVPRVFERIGGGTDMMKGIAHSLARGDEVVIVLTDCQTHWDENGPWGIPVIVGGIRRGGSSSPRWARLVDVEGDKT